MNLEESKMENLSFTRDKRQKSDDGDNLSQSHSVMRSSFYSKNEKPFEKRDSIMDERNMTVD